MLLPPAASPCGSCPYRRDVPSGVWAREEYLKLPDYDLPTGEQPPGIFLCHQKTGSVCAGWCGAHDMIQNLGLRFEALTGRASTATIEAILDYKTDTPLFSSGAEACEHGLKEIAKPSSKAIRTVLGLKMKRERKSKQ